MRRAWSQRANEIFRKRMLKLTRYPQTNVEAKAASAWQRLASTNEQWMKWKGSDLAMRRAGLPRRWFSHGNYKKICPCQASNASHARSNINFTRSLILQSNNSIIVNCRYVIISYHTLFFIRIDIMKGKSKKLSSLFMPHESDCKLSLANKNALPKLKIIEITSKKYPELEGKFSGFSSIFVRCRWAYFCRAIIINHFMAGIVMQMSTNFEWHSDDRSPFTVQLLINSLDLWR